MTCDKTGRSVTIPHRGLPAIRLKRVEDYIRTHLDTQIALSDLAETTRMNVFHFSKLFKKSTGMSPHQYVLHQRIEFAKTLLNDPTLKMIDVALRVGFERPNNFSRAFRKQVGMSPRQFRFDHS
jgi:AraC family transcriptional regulator